MIWGANFGYTGNILIFGGWYKVIRVRDLGRNTSVRRWTNIAIDCYSRGCVCNGCFYHTFFKDSPQRCQMKSTVLECNCQSCTAMA